MAHPLPTSAEIYYLSEKLKVLGWAVGLYAARMQCNATELARRNLFFHLHLDGAFGAHSGADATSLTVIEIDQHVSARLIPRYAEVRAK